MLRAENLVKIYKGRRVVNDISVQVEQGEIVGLLGPNGAGKTTSFYMIVGLIQPNEGKIFLEKEDITSLPMYQRARLGISYLPQEPSVFRKLTVEENIMAILQTVKWPISASRPIDLFPVLGDLAGVLLSGTILVEAARLGAGKAVLARMALNIALEGVAGLVPFAGDLFDAAFKANQRNVRLLDAWLERPGRAERASRWLLAGILAAIAGAIALGFFLLFLAFGFLFGL